MPANLPKNLISISEAAKVLGVSIDTMRRWDKKGLINAVRVNGKDRCFDLEDLENVKFSRPLSISQAAKQLGISVTTLRRLENRGLIKPDRNENGERLFSKKLIKQFLNSEYFLRQQQVEEEVLAPFTKEQTPGQTLSSSFLAPKYKALVTLLNDQKEKLNGVVLFRKILVLAGLFIVAVFTLLVVGITVLFLLFPKESAQFFGDQQKTTVNKPLSGLNGKNGDVLGVSYQVEVASEVKPLLKPFSNISLGIVKQINPQIYQEITAQPPAPPLNADSVMGKKPGTGPGDLVVFDDGNTIAGLKVESANLADTSVTDIKIVQISGSNKVLGSAVQLKSGGGLSDSSGLTLSTSGVTAATYGTSSAVGVFTVDSFGRITSASNTTISGLSVSNFTSANLSAWTNDSGYITAGTTLTGLVRSTASGNSYFTGGNLGIGTSSPVYQLQTTGNVGVGGSLTVSSGLSLPSGSVLNSYLNNSFLTVTAGSGLTGGGSVSLGSSTSISLDLTNANTWTGLQTFSGGLTVPSIPSGSVLFTDSSNNISSNTANFYWDNSNNRLGIGTSAPQTSLYVTGNAMIGYSSGAPASLANGLAVSGSVGIGTTSPSSKLDIRGTAILQMGSASTVYLKQEGNSNEVYLSSEIGTIPLRLYSGGSAKISILSNNVGLFGAETWGTNAMGVMAIKNANQRSETSVANEVQLWSYAYGASDARLYIKSEAQTGDDAMILGNKTLIGGELASGSLTLDSTSNASKGNIILNPTAGNVGIGTISPQASLYVTGNAMIGYASGAPASLANGLAVSGNVGIGTTTPGAVANITTIGGRMLSISNTGGRAAVTLEGSTDARIYLSDTGATTDNKVAILGTDGGSTYFKSITDAGALVKEILWMNHSSGNVGIGTTGPSQLLQVAGTAQINTGLIVPKIYPASDSTTAFQINEADGTTNILNVNTTNGRVGIGTTAPSKKLEVSGDVRITAGNFYLDNNRGTLIKTSGGTDTDAFYADNSNNVTFGTRVASGWNSIRFSPNGSIPVAMTINSVGNVGIGTTGASQLLQINNSTSNPFVVSSGGNVGIGTTSPAVALDVVGNARFSAVGSGASANDLRITADGTLTTNTSDITMKTNLEPIADALNKVLQLKTYYFNWINDPNGPKDVGLIAQQVNEVFPEITFINKTDGKMGVNYSRLGPILIEAVKEQQAQLDGLVAAQASASAILTGLKFEGDATFEGTVTADKIMANQIEGLSIETDELIAKKLTPKLENLSQQIATASAQTIDLNTLIAQASSSAKLAANFDLKSSGLTVLVPAEFKQNSIFRLLVEFFGSVIFHGDINFEGRPTFNKDTAGFAIISKGADSVDVKFEKEYSQVPLVNTSITLDNMADEASQSATERQVLDADIRYIVTRETTKGFTLKLSKLASTDLKFSWTALAVKDAKVALSSPPPVVLGTQVEATPSASIAPSPTPSPTPVPSAGPPASPKIQINNTELGYLRVRDDALVTANEVGQVNPGQTFSVLAEKDGWYEIEYEKGQYGWVSGSYVTVQQ